MIDYRAGDWGFHVAFGWDGSLVPKALTMAIPNALITFLLATMWQMPGAHDIDAGLVTNFHDDTARAAQMVIGAFTTIMTFILYNRSNIAYDRWWEGGTLLQKTRGEWFNAYSSIMAFTSTKPEMQEEVEKYVQLLARLMSLLMCCGLQQVSPNRDRGFEIFDLYGIEPGSMDFLNDAPDKVEIILQWIQRSMVLHMQTGVLPIAPPILSRAFQEVSRGIVNLQNARKIADFPYPYPLAQISMILQILHFAMVPVGAALAMPRMWAVLFSFFSIFVLWCIHFNAIELEFPFGTRTNDLPMVEFQQEWNKSIRTLVDKRATRPPLFAYDVEKHDDFTIAMSDASDLYVPRIPVLKKGKAQIKIAPDHVKNKQGEDSSSKRPGSPLTKARAISALAKCGLCKWDGSHSGGKTAGQPNSVLPTTEQGMKGKKDDGPDLASPVKAVPVQMTGRVEPSSSSTPPAASRSSPALAASSVPEQVTARVEASSSPTHPAASGSSPADVASSRASPAPAKPSELLQRDVNAAAAAAVVGRSGRGRSSTNCFSGTAVPSRADLAGIRLEGLGCCGGTSLFAGKTPRGGESSRPELSGPGE